MCRTSVDQQSEAPARPVRKVHFSETLQIYVDNYPLSGWWGVFVYFLLAILIAHFIGILCIYLLFVRSAWPATFLGLQVLAYWAVVGLFIWFCTKARLSSPSAGDDGGNPLDGDGDNALDKDETAPRSFNFFYRYRLVISFLPMVLFCIVAPVMAVSGKAFTIQLMFPDLLKLWGYSLPNTWMPMYWIITMPFYFSALHTIMEYGLQLAYHKEISRFSFRFSFVAGFVILKLIVVGYIIYLGVSDTFVVDVVPSSENVTFIAAPWCLETDNGPCSFYISNEYYQLLIAAGICFALLELTTSFVCGVSAIRSGQTLNSDYVKDAFKKRTRRLLGCYTARNSMLVFFMFFYCLFFGGLRFFDQLSIFLPWVFLIYIGFELCYSNDVVSEHWRFNFTKMQELCDQLRMDEDPPARELGGAPVPPVNPEQPVPLGLNGDVAGGNADGVAETSFTQSTRREPRMSTNSIEETATPDTVVAVNGGKVQVVAEVYPEPPETSSIQSTSREPLLSTNSIEETATPDTVVSVNGGKVQVVAEVYPETPETSSIQSTSREPLLSANGSDPGNLKNPLSNSE